jgi:hypothetical protein
MLAPPSIVSPPAAVSWRRVAVEVFIKTKIFVVLPDTADAADGRVM